MKNLKLEKIKDFFEGSKSLNHQYCGYFGKNFLVVSTSHSLVHCMACQSAGIKNKSDMVVFNDLSFEYENNDLFKSLLDNFSSAMIADHIVRDKSSLLNGYIDEKILVLSTSKELLKNSFNFIKEDYVNKYSTCVELRSFRPDQISFRVKELIIDNKSVIDTIIVDSKSVISKMDEVLSKVIDVYFNHNDDSINSASEI